jgi:hypothetical protein
MNASIPLRTGRKSHRAQGSLGLTGQPPDGCKRRGDPVSRLRCAAAIALLFAVLITGCTVSGDSGSPVGGLKSLSRPTGDSATFVFPDGGTISVVQSGHIDASGSASPALDYRGPLGCKGHYFTGDYSDHIGISARYSAVDAVMAIGSDVFHFGQPPTKKRKELVWSATFSDGSGHAQRYGLRVQCPLPTDAPAPLLPLR